MNYMIILLAGYAFNQYVSVKIHEKNESANCNRMGHFEELRLIASDKF